MDNIEQASQKISQIIGVIDEIAFQTKPAGAERGCRGRARRRRRARLRGVASEVRALEQRHRDRRQ